MTKLVEVRCAAAPPPGGHYAQGVLHGATLYVSGQLGLVHGMVVETGAAEQVTFALGNVERIARVVGAGRGNVVSCTVFVAGIEHWDKINEAYAAFFGAHRPARSIVPCGPLHFDCKVEVEAVVAVSA